MLWMLDDMIELSAVEKDGANRIRGSKLAV